MFKRLLILLILTYVYVNFRTDVSKDNMVIGSNGSETTGKGPTPTNPADGLVI